MVEQVTFQTLFQFLQTVGILVGVYYYITTIRVNQRNQEISIKNQELALKAQEHATETREAQLFMQLYNRYQQFDWQKQWSVMDKKISGWQEFKERRENDPVFREEVGKLSSFYEGLGVLLKAGYLSIHPVALMWTGYTRTFWENIVEPILDEMREETGYPRGWSETEYACREVLRYIEGHPELKT
jgi:hypothetical protein